jgi:hypothetical protein
MANIYQLIDLLEDFLNDKSNMTLTIDRSEAKSILVYLERELFRFKRDFDSDYDY